MLFIKNAVLNKSQLKHKRTMQYIKHGSKGKVHKIQLKRKKEKKSIALHSPTILTKESVLKPHLSSLHRDSGLQRTLYLFLSSFHRNHMKNKFRKILCKTLLNEVQPFSHVRPITQPTHTTSFKPFKHIYTQNAMICLTHN